MSYPVYEVRNKILSISKDNQTDKEIIEVLEGCIRDALDLIMEVDATFDMCHITEENSVVGDLLCERIREYCDKIVDKLTLIQDYVQSKQKQAIEEGYDPYDNNNDFEGFNKENALEIEEIIKGLIKETEKYIAEMRKVFNHD